MKKIIVRHAEKNDDYIQIASCIYLTDPYIYPAAFGIDPKTASQAIASLMQIRNGLFSYKNIIVATCDDNICGTLLFVNTESSWKQNECNEIVKEYIPSISNFEYVSEKYFQIESICPKDNNIEIVACCVLPEFRQMGIAHKMLQQLFKENMGVVFTLDVLAENKGALSLYEKCGFEIESRFKGFSMNSNSLPDCLHMINRNYKNI